MELFHIFINQKFSLSDDFNIFGVSYKTMINDIDIVIEMGRYYGAEITINREKSEIICNIIDEKLFNYYYTECSAFYAQNRRNPRKMMLRLFKIGEYIIENPSFTKIDELCYELNCSRTNLREDLIYIRKYFKAFHLQLKNVPSYGLKIEGKELDLRLCLIMLNNRTNASALIENINVSERLRKIEIDSLMRSSIREILKEKEIVLSIGELRKIRRYIVLQQKRIKDGKSITGLINSRNAYIMQSTEYEAAKAIYQKLNIDLVSNENEEIYSLAILLLIFQDYTTRHEDGLVDDQFSIDINDLFSQLNNYLIDRWHIDIEKAPKAVRDAIYISLFRLIILKEFDMLSYLYLPMHSYNNSYYYQPVIASITYDLAKKTESLFKHKISNYWFYEIARTLFFYIMTVDVDVNKPNIAFVLGQDGVYAGIYDLYLQRYLNQKLYDHVDMFTFDQYVKNPEKLADYAAIITSTIGTKRLSGDHWYFIDENNGILNSDSLQTVLQKKTKIEVLDIEAIKCFTSSVNNQDDLIDEIVEKTNHYLRFSKEQTNITKDRMVDIMNHRKMVFFVEPIKNKGKSILLLGRLDKEFKFSTHKVDSYAILLLDGNEQSIKCFNLMMRKLIQSHKHFLSLFNNPTTTTINEIIIEDVLK